MHSHKRGDGGIDACQLHRDKAVQHRTSSCPPIPGVRQPGNTQIGYLRDELEWKLGSRPVLIDDRRDHFLAELTYPADNFGVFTSDTILEIYHSATSGIFAVLVGVVGLSLVVGGIVIMNIMLMVVTERTREIGLRKALGARRRDIMWQVLTESVTLSTFGGLAGIFVGSLIGQAISSLTPLPARLEPWSVVLGIGITSIVGLVFGLYPASRAAALDPIEALRRE